MKYIQDIPREKITKKKKKRIEESKIDVINQNIFTFTSSWNNRLNTQIQSLRVFGVLTRGDQLNNEQTNRNPFPWDQSWYLQSFECKYK